MAETLSLQVVLKLLGSISNARDLSLAADVIDRDYTISFSDGTGANQAQHLWQDQRTLTESATEDIDLYGSLTGSFGLAFLFASIKGVVVKAAAANVNDVQLTRPANGAPLFMTVGDGIALGPGEVFAWVSPGATGKTVTNTTADLLTLTNSGGGSSVVYDVFIWGD